MPITPLGGDGIDNATLTSSNTTTGGEDIVFADVSSSSLTVTLATADARSGARIAVVDINSNAGTNAITVDTEGSGTINGASSITITTDGEAVTLVSDGTDWVRESAYSPGSGSSGVAVEDDGAIVVDGATAIDMATNLSVADDGDGTVTVSASGGGGGNKSTTYVISDSYSTSGEDVILVHNEGFTVNLSDSDANDGNTITIVDVQGEIGPNTPFTISGTSSNYVNSQQSVEVTTPYAAVTVMYSSSESEWVIIGGYDSVLTGEGEFATVVEGSETGTVAAGDQGVLVVDELLDGETLFVKTATLVSGTVGAVPTGVDLKLGTFSSGSFTQQAVILSGDGSTVHDNADGNPLASYQNTSGAAQTIGYVVDNQSGGSESVICDAAGEVA